MIAKKERRARTQCEKAPEARICSISGFTLVELLVVIAIISILAGLLLPALESALAQARKVTCAGNQHQIYLVYSTYSSDWDGWLIPNLNGKVNERKPPNHVSEETIAVFAEYDRSGGIFFCPSGEPEEFTYEVEWPQTRFLYNYTHPVTGASVPWYGNILHYSVYAGKYEAGTGNAASYWGHYSPESTLRRMSDRKVMMGNNPRDAQREQARTPSPVVTCIYQTDYTKTGTLSAWSHKREGLNALHIDGSVMWKIYQGSFIDYTGDPEVVKIAGSWRDPGIKDTSSGYGDYGY